MQYRAGEMGHRPVPGGTLYSATWRKAWRKGYTQRTYPPTVVRHLWALERHLRRDAKVRRRFWRKCWAVAPVVTVVWPAGHFCVSLVVCVSPVFWRPGWPNFCVSPAGLTGHLRPQLEETSNPSGQIRPYITASKCFASSHYSGHIQTKQTQHGP